VVGVLQHPDNVRLLFFNGVHDIVCNHVGNERYLWQLPWEHREEWTLAPRYAWLLQNEVVGYMQEFKNLQFLKIMNAGHMVPMDVPGVALEMMKLLVYDGSFDSSLQAFDQATKDNSDSCPVCPTCLERDSGTGQQSVNPPASSSGTSIIRMTWAAAGLGLLVVFAVVYLVRRRDNNIRLNDMRIVPQYDIELRDTNGNGFRDRPPTNGFSGDD
jgi:Serine carboxypeptidase